MIGTVLIVWVLLLVLVVVTLFAGVKTVSQGPDLDRGALRRLHADAAARPELRAALCRPRGRKLNVQEQVVEIPEQSVITRDNATVAVDGIIYYRVMEPEKAAYQVTNLTLALTTLAMTNIRAVIGEMELDATLSSRERINTALLIILDGATMPWGVKVSRVEIRKIEPPENLIRAMNLQMTAERERRAAVARAEGERAGGDPACRGREAGADPARRGPPAGRRSRCRGTGGAGPCRGRGDADGVRGGGADTARPGCATSSPTAMCGRSRRWLRRRTRAWSWCRWRRRRSPAASSRRWNCFAATVAARGAARPRRRRRRSSPRRRSSDADAAGRPAACGRTMGSRHHRDERLDHLAGRRPGVADGRDPRARRLHDVARPGGLWHRAGGTGERLSASSSRW